MAERLTTEEFIARSIKVHGYVYDYSKVDYYNASGKVTIICPVHGEFQQVAEKHSRGCGCAKCAKRAQLTTEEFITKASGVHRDRYDYSKVVYQNAKLKVTIICPVHGEFRQSPDVHLRGSGCRKCWGRPQSQLTTEEFITMETGAHGLRVRSKCENSKYTSTRLTTEEFISRAQSIHGNTYDYSKVKYVNHTHKVTIVCPVHGDFEQSPKGHFRGYGCYKCGCSERKTTEEFIAQAKLVYGERFIYDKAVYQGGRAKITITCREHGDFERVARDHLRGANCPKCRCADTKTFILKARKIHGDRYAYDNVKYEKSASKVLITCNEYGDFCQRAGEHLKGRGCPRCLGGVRGVSVPKHSTEEFVAKCIQVHGDEYDYSKVIYCGAKHNIIIVCKKHGNFHQRASRHISGRRCPKCTYRMTTEEFVSKSERIHNKRYSYSKTKYTVGNEKITITCHIHGDFEQRADKHLSGCGCQKCFGRGIPLTEAEFISKATKKHSGRYGYDKVVYLGCREKVIVTCHKHGDFEQSAAGHLSGVGCPKCGVETRTSAIASNMEEFITKSKQFHGDKYDYDKVVYRNCDTKVTITCRTHGDFKQKPVGHLKSRGCPVCESEYRRNSFMTNAVKIHGKIYDYSKVDYINSDKRVIITCTKHGDFKQVPSCHLRGSGCPKCNSSKGETAIRTWLEEHQYEFKEQRRFQSCKNINTLPFDFEVSVPHMVLIEFNGIQHYEPFSFRRNKDTPEQMEANLAKLQHNDAIKAKWCADNNIPLLVIPYWDKHRIPELLEEFLGSASLVGAV
jgi:hypothetical protein